jgi:hypothetical protein
VAVGNTGMSLYRNTPALFSHSRLGVTARGREGFGPGGGVFGRARSGEGFPAYYSEDSGAVGVAVSATGAANGRRPRGWALRFVESSAGAWSSTVFRLWNLNIYFFCLLASARFFISVWKKTGMREEHGL